MSSIEFVKTGKEIKEAAGKRRAQLAVRLEARNTELNEFLSDPSKVRSYLIRHNERYFSSHSGQGYMLHAKDEISSEERNRIDQLCRRIAEIEQETFRLSMIENHLCDQDEFNLTIGDLVGYGFEASIENSTE